MSVLIKGMKMPTMCEECQIRAVDENSYGDIMYERCPITCEDVGGYGWQGKRERHPDCPLVEVKEPHGRLIDAEVVNSALKKRLLAVDTAPTVIEAEGKNE